MMVIKRYAYYQYYSRIKLHVYYHYRTANKPKPIRLQHSLEVPNQIDTTTALFQPMSIEFHVSFALGVESIN